MTTDDTRPTYGERHAEVSYCDNWGQVDELVAEALEAERERIRRQIGHQLGHDLRALATGAETALHCAWPTMFLRVLDVIGWEDEEEMEMKEHPA